MAEYVLPKRGVAWIGYIGLVSQADTKLLIASPTLAAGDFKISKDGGATANLTTLPTNTPAASSQIKISLSATEMEADNVSIIGIDAAGAEWCSFHLNIQTATRAAEDLAFPTVTGRSLDVSAGGEAGIDWNNIGSPTTTLALTGTTIATTQKVDVETIKTNPVVNAGTVTFPTTATLASTTNITAGTMTTTTNLTNLPSIPANWLTAAGAAADFGTELATAIWTDTTAGDFTVALSIGKSIINGVALGTGLTINAYTGNTVQTGDSFARIGAAGASLTDLGGMSTTMKAQVEAEVDDALGAGTGTSLTAIPWNAAWDAEVQSEVQDALDGTLADSVPADGTRPSISQAAYMLVQRLTEFAIVGTTITVNKVDGTTALFTLTLDSAASPTSSTRAT